MKILIGDSNGQFRNSLKYALMQRKHEVMDTFYKDVLLQTLRENKDMAMVILDFVLLDRGPIETIRKVLDRNPQPQLWVMAEKFPDGVTEELIKAGVNKVLLKKSVNEELKKCGFIA